MIFWSDISPEWGNVSAPARYCVIGESGDEIQKLLRLLGKFAQSRNCYACLDRIDMQLIWDMGAPALDSTEHAWRVIKAAQANKGQKRLDLESLGIKAERVPDIEPAALADWIVGDITRHPMSTLKESWDRLFEPCLRLRFDGVFGNLVKHGRLVKHGLRYVVPDQPD